MRQVPFSLRKATLCGLALALCSWAVWPVFGAEPPGSRTKQRPVARADNAIIVEHDDNQVASRVIIAARGGQLDWCDVLQGLAQVAELDSDPVTASHRWKNTDLSKAETRWSLRLLSAALPDVKLRISDHPVLDEPALSIRLERAEARDKVRLLKAYIRENFGDDTSRYGLQLADRWEQQPHDRPLVVLVHGYNQGTGSLTNLREALVEGHWPCGLFVYSNDGPIQESGELLAEELRRFRRAHGARDVVLIAHSMGGLVARVAVETKRLDPGNVTRLIMICTPNQGSKWAELPGGLDCYEYYRGGLPGDPVEAFRASLSDGLNEARTDLKLQSRFLRQLNSRPRNPRVRYSLILGTGGPLTALELAALKRQCIAYLAEERSGRVFLPRVHNFFEGLEEPLSGKGDGVVAVSRGKLEGVTDTLLLPIEHRAILGNASQRHVQLLHRAIFERLSDSY